MIRAAIDWGSSAFRAYRFDVAGNPIESVVSASGIKFAGEKSFEAIMRQQIGPWLSPGDTVLLSGMITSRNGWLESEYIKCPVNLDTIMRNGSRLALPDISLVFLPGVSQSSPPDVMRGEELQLLGAESGEASGVYVIPGTHAKWAQLDSGVLRQFRTIPTGELFDLVVKHSLMGALLSHSGHHRAAYSQGVELGFNSKAIVSDLFTTRSAVLLGQRSGDEAYSWLSGLLIGNEIREGTSSMPENTAPLRLIGSSKLCEKYFAAFDLLGIDAAIVDADITIRGFQRVIQYHQAKAK